MSQIIQKIEKTLNLMGFSKARVLLDEEHRKFSIFLEEDLSQAEIASLLSALDHFINLVLRRENLPSAIIDVNYYRKERERLILELAKAAAKKAMMTKSEVALPPMNAYERRLVHVEITTHPELKTESAGEGKDRHVLIKHLD